MSIQQPQDAEPRERCEGMRGDDKSSCATGLAHGGGEGAGCRGGCEVAVPGGAPGPLAGTWASLSPRRRELCLGWLAPLFPLPLCLPPSLCLFPRSENL